MVAEKVLVKNIKKGQEDAYRQVVEEYGNRLLRTCYLILKDREEAEDVVQETFIKVFHKMNSFRENSNLYSWIYTIALNLSRDRLRKKQDMLTLEDEWVGNNDVEYEVEGLHEKITGEEFTVAWDEVEGATYYKVDIVTYSNPSEGVGTISYTPAFDENMKIKFTENQATFNTRLKKEEIGGMSIGEDGLVGANAVLVHLYLD